MEIGPLFGWLGILRGENPPDGFYRSRADNRPFIRLVETSNEIV
jgi:hypothetical protein